MRKEFKYLLTLVVLLLIANISFYLEKEFKIKEHLSFEVNQIQLNYNVIFNEHKEIAKIIFDTKINQKEIIDIFKNAYSADEKQKKLLREKLYSRLKSTYKKLKDHNLRQLHFHLPDNTSFLRFHKPEKYGDDLTMIRPMIDYVNKEKKYIDGFEEGKICNGYRYIYPIFDENKKFIGSVEISFSTVSFSEIFYEQFQANTNFLILKKVVNEKVFEDEKRNYIPTDLKSFYIEKKAVTKDQNKINTYTLLEETKKRKELLNKEALKGKVFTSGNSRYELYFLPVKNPVTKKLEAVLMIRHNHFFIKDKLINYYISSIFTSLLLIAIVYLLYRYDKKQANLRDTKRKLETVLSEADSGIGIMDINGNFLEVNNAYCRILGYKKEELLKLNCVNLTFDEQKEKSLDILKVAQEIGSISKFHKVCVKKDKSLINLEFSLTLLPSKDAFIAVINSIEDRLCLEKLNNNLQKEVDMKVEELRTKENMLFRQSKDAALGEMIDTVAHQWKNPLGIIRLLGQEIKLQYELYDNPDTKLVIECADDIDLQVIHLLNTLEEFRSFFRPNLEYKDVTVGALLDSIRILMKDELIKNTIEMEISGDLESSIHIIPNQFKHVIINLITNSRDAFIENHITKKPKNRYQDNRYGR